MENKNFATIKEIPLKNYFAREDTDFTPWLQENIQLLGDTIGINISDCKTEVPIGTYRLDVLASELDTNRIIAIENQFEGTDHDHLGKLITYMAGVNADVMIWIAEKFREEHITAINHLNQISNEDTAFFCVKPRIIQIDDSKPAFEFIIITQPDEWEKGNQPQGLNELEREYRRFWSLLINEYSKENPELKNRKAPKSNSFGFNAGKSGFSYGWRFSKDKTFDITLWIDTGDKEINQEIFDQLYERKEVIESKLGVNMGYFFKENVRLVVFYLTNDVKSYIMNLNDDGKKDIINWAIEWMPKFRTVFDPLIQNLE